MRTSLLLLLTSLLPSAPAWAVPDACDDGVQELGGTIPMATGPQVAFTPDARKDSLGWSIAVADFDGDGIDDIAMGAPAVDVNGRDAGAVFVYFGPLGATASYAAADADVTLLGEALNDRAGWALSAGDVDGDGAADLMVGAHALAGTSGGAGVAYLVAGTTLASASLVDLATQSQAVFVGGAPGDQFGTTVALSDIDDDGFADVLIGAPKAAGGGTARGEAYLFHGPLSGAVFSTDADATFVGANNNSSFGIALDVAGDLTGDGIQEIIIGAPRDTTAAATAGAAFIFTGDDFATFPPPGPVAATSATWRVYGSKYSRLGASVAPAGDLNNDLIPDVWIGAKQYGSRKQGAVFALSGALPSGSFPMPSTSLHTMIGGYSNELAGTRIHAGADLNGDGINDLIIGGERGQGAATQAGVAAIMHGPFVGGGVTDLALADARIQGTIYLDFVGSALGAGDLNDDGFDDAAVGGWRSSDHLYRAGTVGLFLGGRDLADLGTWYADTDGDGFGAPGTGVEACAAPPLTVSNDQDCDDSSTLFQPSAPEGCADPDYNCDGVTGAVDGDSDGYDACGGDCDDNDPDRNPGEDERCGDGVDNNCDGAIDDGLAVDAQTWFADIDQDGFGNAAFPFVQCTAPTGSTPFILVGGDCDDANIHIHPDAIEVCDGADNNCDSLTDEGAAADATAYYRDADADGWGDPFIAVRACTPPTELEDGVLIDYVAQPGDCNDNVFATRPGTVETCDGKDNDCDGVYYLGGQVDSEARAFLTLSGHEANAKLGSSGAFAIADLDADGDGELLITDTLNDEGAEDGGAVFIRRGGQGGGDLPLNPTLGSGGGGWNIKIVGSRRTGRLGASVATGDINGDTFTDLVIGAPGARVPGVDTGAVYIFLGPFADGTMRLEDATVELRGAAAGDLAGQALDVGDLDGDGYDDLLIGARGATSDRGAAYVVYGSASLSGSYPLAAEATFAGLSANERTGAAVAIVGDLDGDGYTDALIGAPDAGSLQAGAVHVLYGTASRFAGALLPDATLTGSRSVEGLGQHLTRLGDINGDTRVDVGIGTRRNTSWVLLGAASRWTSGSVAGPADVQFTGPFGSNSGRRIAAVGDVNADGIDDLAVSADDDDEAGRDAGAVFVVYGSTTFLDRVPANGQVLLADLESFGRLVPGTTFPTLSAANLGTLEGAKIVGFGESSDFGTYVSGANLDGLGGSDLVIAAPNYTTTSPNAGRVSLFLGGAYGTDLGVNDGTEGTWYPDLDQDGWTDGTSYVACPMHVPTDLSEPVRLAATIPSLAADCVDTNPNIHPCHTESNSDGIDSNCDGSDNIVADFDGDGLSYLDEINLYGTCPDLADTDGDGVDDDLEIARGSDPDDPASFIRGIDALSPGDLQITEVMANPQNCNDGDAEYVEVLYRGTFRVDLDDLDLFDNTNQHTLHGVYVVNPGDRILFTNNFTGFAFCYGFAPLAQHGFGLGNSGDSFRIEALGVEIDAISFTSAEAASGVALERDDNDPATFCAADTFASNGDFGSPGEPNGSCGGSGWPGIDTLAPSHLRITEIMVDPDACDDEGGEYVEILFTGTQRVDLFGLTLEDNAGSVSMGSIVVDPGDRILIARTATQYISCYGVPPTGQYGFGLDNTGDLIRITDGASVTFDTVDFSGWTSTPGAAFERDDAANRWCLATDSIGNGDLGTPGAANGACTADDFDWDGVADSDEACVGGNPFLADSDGDGTIDGVEIVQGTNVGGADVPRTWRFIASLDNVQTTAPATAPGWTDDFGGLITFDPDAVDVDADPSLGLFDITGFPTSAQVDTLLMGGTSDNAIAATDLAFDSIDLDIDAPNTLGDPSIADFRILLQLLGYSTAPNDALPADVVTSSYYAFATVTVNYVAGGSHTVSGDVLTLCNDEDDDGLCNADEILTGSNPWAADSDGDGLSDRYETNATLTGTCTSDTDGDGTDDGTEATLGTDPLDPLSRPLSPDDLLPGDLLITEFMADPSTACGDVSGEYFEVLYTGPAVVLLDGLIMVDATPSNSQTLSGGVVAYPGDRLVFARSTEFATCYGFAPHAVSGLALNNTGDLIRLSNSTAVLASVDFTPGSAFTVTDGIANERDDDGSNLWCDADTASSSGDLGTPAAPNGACPPPSTADSIDDLLPGDLIITEYTNDPDACFDSDGEYIELLYQGASAVDLDGLILGDANDVQVMSGSVIVNPGDRVLLARFNDAVFCYGYNDVPDYTFVFALRNSGADSIVIANSFGELDRVDYDTGSTTPGRSMRLSDDDLTTWCVDNDHEIASSGDYGTPGAANGDCPPPPTGSPKVFISEVMDAVESASARYLELYNAGDAAADLGQYTLKRYCNGSNSTCGTFALSGTLAPGGTFVVGKTASYGFAGTFGAEPDVYNFVIDGNGDDVYQLELNGTVVDAYGDKGTDGTGTAWEYEDAVVHRACFVTEGTATFDVQEWVVGPEDSSATASLGSKGDLCPEGTYAGTADMVLSGSLPCPGSATVTLDLDAPNPVEGTGQCLAFGALPVPYAFIGTVDLITGTIAGSIVDSLASPTPLAPFTGGVYDDAGVPTFFTDPWSAGIGGVGSLAGSLDLPLQ